MRGFNAETQRGRGWEVRKIKFTFTERKQKGFPELPLLAATQNHGVILKSKYENRTVEATKALDTLKVVEVGDFVISLRSFQGGLEMAYDRGIISPAYTILTPTHITREYFKYFAKSPTFIALLKSTVTGIREGQNIDYNRLRDYYIEIPPVREQLSIGAYLDAETGRIDKAIAAEEKMLSLLQERREIVINEAVSPRDGWEMRRLRYLVDFSTGNKDTVDRVDGGVYPFFVRSPRVERINSYTFDGEAILMAGDGVGAGKVFHHYIGKFDYHQRVYNIHNFRHVFARFLFYYIQQNFKYVIELAEAKSTVDSVRIQMLKNFPIPLPPLPEQEEIVKRLDAETGRIDRAIEVKRRQIELLRERRQIVIDEAVTGKVKVA